MPRGSKFPSLLPVILLASCLPFSCAMAAPFLADPSVGKLRLVVSGAANLPMPEGLGFDVLGNLFVTHEITGATGGISYVDKNTGAITRLASGISRADGIALALDGGFFVTSEVTPASTTNRLYRVDVVYSASTPTSAAATGLTTSIGINIPEGIALAPPNSSFGATGTLFVSEDANPGRIYSIDPVSGNAQTFVDASSRLNRPEGAAFGHFNCRIPLALYVPESGANRIRRIEADGRSSIFGNATEIGLRAPDGLKFGPDGFIYVAEDIEDGTASGRIVRIGPDGMHMVFAGGFSDPSAIAFDPTSGHLYIAEQGTSSIWQVEFAVPSIPPSSCNPYPVTDLSISVVDSPDPVNLGGNVTYALAVTNNGPAPASGVVASEILPVSATFISSSASQGSCIGTNVISCNLGTLAVAESATVTIVVKPKSAGPMTSFASVTSNEEDLYTANNRAASTTLVAVPDLVVSEVSNPPASARAGTTFSVTDTTANAGSGPSAASTTRYRLSLDATVSTADPLLTGTRAIPALSPGASSSGTVTVTIPTSLAPGSYYFAACADDTRVNVESSESNNCRVAAAAMQVTKPDLVVSALSDPPASARAGTAFSVTDTTANAGSGPSVASTTRYRLSLDATISTADPLLTGTRAVPALSPGASSSGTVTVTIPTSLAPGSYYFAACADDTRVNVESSESNNCRVAATTVTVSP